MSDIVVYTSSHCPFCRRVKSLLDSKGTSYREINIELDEDSRMTMVEQSGRRTVPQIFVEGIGRASGRERG